MTTKDRAARQAGDEFEDESTAVYTLADIKSSAIPPAARHVLVHMDGADVGRVVALSARAEFVIGRRPDCDLQLCYEGVSRRHARVLFRQDEYIIEDLGSANGTRINGQAITLHTLQDGDVLRFGPSVSVRYSVTDTKEEDLLRKMYAATVTDSLTGAHNREYMDEQLRLELDHYQRKGQPLTLSLLDLDHFKRVNDRFGHQAGDAVLVEVVSRLRSALSGGETLARYGGEEFAVIHRGKTLQQATAQAEEFRRRCDCSIGFRDRLIPISVSVGCAAPEELSEATSSNLIALADERLYRAKRSGRNRVVNGGV